MANATVKHATQSAVSDLGVSGEMGPDEWNEAMAFSAGSLGSLLYRDAGSATGATWASALTNGQLLIGSTGAAPVAASLTAGTNITITPGAGSISIAAAGVVVGDSPTWTGQHTFSHATAVALSNAAARLKLTGATGMIFIGATTDRGWAVPGFQIGALFGFSGSTSANSGVNVVGTNFYDTGGGVIKRLEATDGVIVLKFDMDPTASLVRVLSAAAGAQDSTITLTELARFTQAGGFIVGAPTGGDKGAGTINATAVYDANTLLTDWVWDLYYAGRPCPDDPHYRDGGRLYPFAETLAVTRRERRLPWMPARAEFEAGRALGALVSRLWLGQEQQQIYLFEQARRLAALEGRRD